MNQERRCKYCLRPIIGKPYGGHYCTQVCCTSDRNNLRISEFHCTECHQVFEPTENYQYTCLPCKEKLRIRMQSLQEERLNIICSCCNLTFRRKKIESGQTQCDDCRRQKIRIHSIERSEKNNIESMKENRRRGGPGISYEKLIAIEEKKRLYDQRHWENYTRGKFS